MTASTGLYCAKFGGADLAAAASQANMPVLGEPDTADFAAVIMPKRGRLIAVEVVGKPATGDTVVVQAVLGGAPSGPTALANNSLVAQLVSVGPNDGVICDGGTLIAMGYTTTTAGTYTARDIYAEAIFELLDN